MNLEKQLKILEAEEAEAKMINANQKIKEDNELNPFRQRDISTSISLSKSEIEDQLKIIEAEDAQGFTFKNLGTIKRTRESEKDVSKKEFIFDKNFDKKLKKTYPHSIFNKEGIESVYSRGLCSDKEHQEFMEAVELQVAQEVRVLEKEIKIKAYNLFLEEIKNLTTGCSFTTFDKLCLKYQKLIEEVEKE